MELKVSRYNHFFKADDEYILAYNALSNSFARVKGEEYEIIKSILKDPNGFSFDSEEKNKLKDDLLSGSFLIGEELDEIEFLKMRNRVGRFSTDFFGLTVAPTLECNFKCEYCFEKVKRESMTKEVEEAIIKMVEEKIATARGFSVTWFGGEPLLRMDVIERLSRAFKKLCEANKVAFSPQSIITNGYLLTGENARRLKDLNITKAQITIDGPPELHDKRRKLKNGKSTFARIIENIRESKDIMSIVVRVNVDEDNYNHLDRLYNLFDENGFTGKVPLYLGRVVSSTNACADVSSRCFSIKDFSNIVLASIKKDFKVKPYTQYPNLTHFGVCGADKYNSYVVTPAGILFKCWNETSFDEEKSVGNLLNKKMEPIHIRNLTRYLNWDPFSIKKCVNCKFLPICGGGCPYFSLNSMDSCTTWKYHLKEMLKLRYNEIIKSKNKGG